MEETCVDINGEYCPICEDKERLLDIIMNEPEIDDIIVNIEESE
jgi:hypothetical protein